MNRGPDPMLSMLGRARNRGSIYHIIAVGGARSERGPSKAASPK